MYHLRHKLIILVSFFLIVVLAAPLGSAHATEHENQEGEPILQFPVISDIHIDGEVSQERLKNALSDFQQIAPNYEAIAMVGDNTNMGTVQQYDNFNSILSLYSNSNAEKIIAIGNHEYWEGLYFSAGLDTNLYQKRFLDKTGMPGSKVYYDKWIGAYHFITLGSEGFPVANNGDYALISDEQYRWLEEALAQNSNPSKPIFVFLHQPIDHTVYGSDDWGAGFTDNRLITILKQYPQVILFSGHSHYILNHPRNIYQDGFSMVNVGSVQTGYSDLGYNGNSQGLLVNVYNDRVEIKAREFTNHTDIQTFTVKTPYQKTYGDSQRPFFRPGTQLNLENNSGDSVKISFNPAIDNTLVDKYMIKANGKTIYTYYVNYWYNSDPEKVTLEMKGLTPETKYNFSIIASDAWNNQSYDTLETSLTTPKLNGWKTEGEKWVYYENGIKITGWKYISGHWYLFQNDGIMYTGWYTKGIQTYYLNVNGAMQTGWKEIQGKQYYFGNDGALKKGWIFDHNKWYYLDNSGESKLGWLNDGGKWYYLKADGMVIGWQKIENNNWYYFNNKGAMQTGWVLSGGNWYYLNSSGVMETGWIQSANKWYFMGPNGEMKTGWIYQKNKWYYLKNDGSMQSGKAKIDNKWYFFATDGSLYS